MKWKEIRILPVVAIVIVILLYWMDKDPDYNAALKTGKEYVAVTFFVTSILVVLYAIFCGLRYVVRK